MKKSLKALFLCMIFAAATLSPTATFAVENNIDYNMQTDVYDIEYGGRVAIEVGFERPFLAGESPAFAKINNDLIAKSKQFYEHTVADQIADYAESAYWTGQTFHDSITSEVVKNDNGILCVKMSRHWYMGGVGDGGEYGVTYNIYTGDEIKIPDLFDMETTEVEKYIKDKAIAYVSAPDFFPEAVDVIKNRNINDFNFYVMGDCLYLCFAKYEVIYGAAGPQIIEYPIIYPKKISPIKVLLNDKEILFDVHPQTINDRTMVPMRAIFEELGATVDWNGETQTVSSVKGDTIISLTIDVPSIIINGEEKSLDVAPVVIDGRTLVPIRAISEALMLNVDWDETTKTVLITNY